VTAIYDNQMFAIYSSLITSYVSACSD